MDGEGANLLSDSKRVDDAISHVPSFEPIRVIALDDEEGGCDGGKEDGEHSRRSRRWHAGEVGKKGEERGKLADQWDVDELEEEYGLRWGSYYTAIGRCRSTIILAYIIQSKLKEIKLLFFCSMKENYSTNF